MSTLPSSRFASALARHAIAAALALPALYAGPALAGQLSPPTVPTALRPPEGNVPFLVGHATGTQDYVCRQLEKGYGWTLQAPAATLVDDEGRQIMTHFGGPTWQAHDGSSVVATREAGATVSGDAIPWLLLRATLKTAGQDGGDRLVDTTYIQRVNTTGGLAPEKGCNKAATGDVTRVPYTSDYYFYRLNAGQD